MKNSGMYGAVMSKGNAPSTWDGPGLRYGARWIASAPEADQHAFLESLGEDALRALPFLFEFWAMPHQVPPDGDWRSWVIMGGRGAGKTRAGAEWVRGLVEGDGPRDPGRVSRVALVGETVDQVREVMIHGESGIIACCPPDRRPRYNASRKRLEWPNGAIAHVHTAFSPEGLRGPQFDAAWVDELAKWPNGQDTWDMLQFALRRGDDPRVCVTTTPRNVEVLKRLLNTPSTVVTHAPTEANRANLAASFLEEVQRRYAGTRLGRQELNGELLIDVEGALWPSDALAACQVDALPQMDRIVVGIDPSVGGADACGIVVAGAVLQGAPQQWRGYVLEDVTLNGSSAVWADAAVAAMERWNGDRIVAEVNQGGTLVRDVIRSLDPFVPITMVHASRGKVARAEPVAALYEQGRVRHARGLQALEDQMTQMTTTGYAGRGSPDRVDALVWALHDLMIAPARQAMQPRLRRL